MIEVMQNSPLCPLGRLPLTGPLNLGRTRPTGLAYSPECGLLAVSTRSGSIHLIELAWRRKPGDDKGAALAAGPDGVSRR